MIVSAALMIFVLLLLLSPFPGAPRRGCGINDLRRWKQYGGTLERPPAPPASRPRTER